MEELDPEAIRIHKEMQGFTDEDFKNLTSAQRRIMNTAPQFWKYKMIYPVSSIQDRFVSSNVILTPPTRRFEVKLR